MGRMMDAAENVPTVRMENATMKARAKKAVWTVSMVPSVKRSVSKRVKTTAVIRRAVNAQTVPQHQLDLFAEILLPKQQHKLKLMSVCRWEQLLGYQQDAQALW